MHEVKVFDSSGKLKKVITVKALNVRSQKQIEDPSKFMKSKRGPRGKVAKIQKTPHKN